MDQHHILPQIKVTDVNDSQTSLGTSPTTTTTTITSRHKLSVPDLVSHTNGIATSTSSLPQTTDPSPHSEQWWTGKYDFAAKIIILGDYGIGKSMMLSTLGGVRGLSWCRCLSFQPQEYVEMECVHKEKKILIRIMDTGGQERFRSMTSSYFRGAHGCLLMYNVTSEESFNNVINWHNDLDIYAPPDNVNSVSAVLVGVTGPTDRPRAVEAERAFRLAESLNLIYCETHVQDQQNVLCILTRLVNSVIVSRARRQSLAITIMPPAVQLRLERKAKKRRRCCRTS